MELNKVQKKELRSKVITIRTYPSYSIWMKENKVSPSMLFNKALEEMKKEE